MTHHGSGMSGVTPSASIVQWDCYGKAQPMPLRPRRVHCPKPLLGAGRSREVGEGLDKPATRLLPEQQFSSNLHRIQQTPGDSMPNCCTGCASNRGQVESRNARRVRLRSESVPQWRVDDGALSYNPSALGSW